MCRFSLLLALSVACSTSKPPPGFFVHKNVIGSRDYSAFSCTNASFCPLEAAAACEASTCRSFASSPGWKSGKVAQLYHVDFNGSRAQRGWTMYSMGNMPPPAPARFFLSFIAVPFMAANIGFMLSQSYAMPYVARATATTAGANQSNSLVTW